MPLIKIRFKPGIDREGSQYTASDPLTWFDADKVRFQKGRPKQIGGWQDYSLQTAFPVDEVVDAVGPTYDWSPTGEQTAYYRGVCRSIFDWVTSTGYKHLGIGTNTKFYIEYGNFLYDITPLRDPPVGNVTFAATNGSSTVTVTHVGHGAVTGDYVKFTGAVSLGVGGTITAAVLNHEYEIESVLTADTYTIIARTVAGVETAANASDTTDGGPSVVGSYQINTGTNAYVGSLGWGSGGWGTGGWGGGGSVAFADQLRLWSQTEFGDDLIINPRGGGIYYWDQSDDWSGTGPGDGYATRANNIADTTAFPTSSGAPIIALQVMLSEIDKHVIVFGTNNLGDTAIDPLLVRWSDEESALDWTPTATNSAGGQVLSSGNYIVGAIQTRQEILIFTDTSIHSMRFVGGDFIYQFSVISADVTSVSPNAATAVGDAVFFMYNEGFYVYRGAIERLNCTVLSYVFDNIDKDQMFKVFAWQNPVDAEIWWFYPDTTQSPGEVNRYVIYNYQEDTWSIGSFDRGAWIHAHSRSLPIASSNDVVNINQNYLYYHEFGYEADGASIAPFIESGEIELGEGEQYVFLRRVIPDFRYEGNENQVDLTLTLKTTDFPQDDPVTDRTHEITASTKQVHTRVRARSVVMRYDGEGTGYGWTMGDHRFDVRTDGKR
jgi:hypothetical protein